MKNGHRLLVLCLLGWWLLAGVQPAWAQSADAGGVVRAVLFYSPTCGHCEYVITQVLPPLFEQYGDRLQMIGVDVSSESGSSLFMTVLQKFELESAGVPFLVVGDTYLVGSLDIPENFPGIVESYLAQGGVGWPDIPGLDQALEAAQQQAAGASASPTAAASSVPAATPSPVLASAQPGGLLNEPAQLSLGDRLAQDPAGNALAVVVLVGMLVMAVWSVFYLWRAQKPMRSQARSWVVPLLCLVGLGVAGYLAFVETAHVEAVCGPVGDCNTVQQSQYARLFGVLPIGILGLAGYAALLAAWAVNRYGDQKAATLGSAALLGLSAFGLLFSIYLTFLEPFVIGATCAWCLSSAMIMALIFWLSLPDGKRAWHTLRKTG